MSSMLYKYDYIFKTAELTTLHKYERRKMTFIDCQL